MKWFTLTAWQGWVAIGIVMLFVGVTLAATVNLRPESSEEGAFSLEEVLLGMPATAPTADAPWRPGDRLTQKRTYATNDPLALRVVSREPPERQLPLTVRLLREDGSVQALSPSAITVSGGTGGFCCWTVEPAGKYKLQIFAPGEAPFVLPITIVPARNNASPLKLQ